MRGIRLIILTPLQKHAIQIAYQGHQGQVETKALPRETVRFLDMDKQVRTELEHCLACQSISSPNHLESIKIPPNAQPTLG